MTELNHRILKMDIERKMKSEFKGPKSIVKEIGVSRDTYFHVLRGNQSPNVKVLLKFIDWLKTDIRRYINTDYVPEKEPVFVADQTKL